MYFDACDFATVLLPSGQYRHTCRRCRHRRITRGATFDKRCVDPKAPLLQGDWPGAYLKQMLALMAAHSRHGCGCDDKAAKMNAWGAAGCREHRDEILAWMREEYKNVPWWDLPVMTARAAAAGLIPTRQQLLSPIEWIVDEAIRRAEAARVA